MQHELNEDQLRQIEQLLKYLQLETNNISPGVKEILNQFKKKMSQSTINISSRSYYGLPINIDIRKEIQKQVDPFSKYFPIYFQTVISQTKDLESMKIDLEKDINNYVKSLYLNFIPYSYFKYLEKSKNKVSSSISFKQFASLNISLNIFSMMEAIYKKLFLKRTEEEKQMLQSWLLVMVEKSLITNISNIKKHFPQTQVTDDHSEQVIKMKKCLLKIDRRQNQEYDFFIMNNIQYLGAENLILQIMKKVSKISSEGYRLDYNSQEQTLQNQIIKLNSLIFQQSTETNNSKRLNEKMKENMYQKLNKEQVLHYNKEPLRKIRNSLKLQCQNKTQLIEIMFENKKQSSSYLRILMKFIQNLLSLLEDPTDLTLLRKYPYKNHKNQLIQPNETLNKHLFQNISRINSSIKDNEARDTKQITDQSIKILKEIKEKLFKRQRQIIFSNFGKPNTLLNRQLNISSQIYKDILLTTFDYLQKLIEIIIEAGKVQNQDGKIIDINLVTFNLGDLFRAKKSFSIEQFRNVINALHALQDPLPFDSLPAQNIFRILRYKDKTSQQAKGILLNYIYKNAVQCELQINTKKQGFSEIFQVNHMLYELKRGQFGIISQILTLIATYYMESNHQAHIFKESLTTEADKSIVQQEANIKKFIFSAYEKQQQKEQKKTGIIQNFRNWTNIFIKQSQQSEQKIRQRMNFQKRRQNKNKLNRIESIVNEDNNLLSKIKQSKESKFIKNLVIKIRKGEDYLAKITLTDLRIFRCVQRLALNGFSQRNRNVYNIITNIDFLNIYTLSYIKELDLSQNDIGNMNSFFNNIIYHNLQVLNLSKNRLYGSHQFAIGWFPKLRTLNLTENRIISLKIANSFTCPKQNITLQSQLKSLQTSKQVQLQRQRLQTQWIQFISKTKIEIIDQDDILTILIDYNDPDLTLKPNTKGSSAQQQLCDIRQQQTLKKQDKIQIKPIKQLRQPNQSIKIYETKIIKQKQSKNVQNKCILHLRNNNVTNSNQSNGKKIIEQQLRLSKDYLSKTAVFFESMSGVILRIQNRTITQKANGLKIYHNIVLAPAHSIIDKQEHSSWLNPSKHRQIKKLILKRAAFRQDTSKSKKQPIRSVQYTCKDIWIPPAYLYEDHRDQYMDICLLYLNGDQQSQKEDQKENIILHLVYKEQNFETSSLCTLTAYIFGYLEDLKNYGHYIVDIEIDNSHSHIEVKNRALKNGASGSLLANIQITGKKSYKYYILGLYKSFMHDSSGIAAKINSQVKKICNDMIGNQFKQKHKSKNKISFQSYQKFIDRKKKYIPIEDVIKKEGNQLIFLRKFLKIFVNLLERYLFIDEQSLVISKEFFLKIHLYDFKQENGGDFYEADLRGIRLKSIFTAINGDFKFVEQSNQLLCEVLIQQQKYTVNTLKIVLQMVKSLFRGNSAQQIILSINNFIQSKLSGSTIYKPISLLKVLQVIIWTVDYKDQGEIIASLQQLNDSSLLDYSYFSIINILINLNSCRRINYYSEIIRCSKDAPKYVNVDDNLDSICNTDSNNISYQNDGQFQIKIIKKREEIYFSALAKVKDILQKRYNNRSQQNPQNQLFENEIKKIFMLQTLKDFYQEQQIQPLIKQFHKNKAHQFEEKILLILESKIKNLLKNEFEQQYLVKKTQQIKILFLNNLKKQFTAICYYFQSLFEDSQLSNNNFDSDIDYTEYKSCMQTNELTIYSQSLNTLQQQHEKTDEQNNFKKKIVQSQGENNTSVTQNSKLKGIDHDENKDLYENHIGLIYIYDDESLSIEKHDRKFAFGTGVLIEKRIVSTAAHVLTPFIHGSFTLGKIKFQLTKGKYLQQPTYESANVVEIRLIKSKDIALLLLDRDLLKQPQIRLVTHNKISQESNFKGRSYFCQVVGYTINMHQYDWRLRKSEGYISIEDVGLADFNYTLSTVKGQSGGAILFFPTGNYNQPYMLGIHTEGSVEISNFLGINKNLYVNEVFNKGRKFSKDLFDRRNKFVAIYLAKDYTSDQKILDFHSIHQNSYIFSTQMYEISKWKLISNMHQAIFKEKQDKIYGLAYNSILDYMWDHFQIQEMSPENLFCYDLDSYHPFFDIKINNYHQKFQKQSSKQKFSEQKRTNAKKMFQKAINLYDRHISAIKMISKQLQFIKMLNEVEQYNLQDKFEQFKLDVNAQLIKLKNSYLIMDNDLKSINKQCQQLFNVNEYIKKLSQLIEQMDEGTNKIENIKQIKNQSIIYKDYSKLQQQFFNDQHSFKEYLSNFKSKTMSDEDELINLGKRYRMIKTACRITYSFYNLYLKSRVKKIQNQFQISQILQLNNKSYEFIPKQSMNPSTFTNKGFYINDLKHRASALFLIEKISYLEPQWRQVLIQKIMNFGRIKQYWEENLLQRSEKLPQDLMNKQVHLLTKIISQIYRSYHYAVEEHYHFANLGRCCLEEIYLLKQIAQKYLLSEPKEEDLSDFV